MNAENIQMTRIHLQRMLYRVKRMSVVSFSRQLTYSSTVNDKLGAISSSGTSSGRNLAGVTQGNLSLTGKSVTITSPFSNCCPAPLVLGSARLTCERPTTDDDDDTVPLPEEDLAGLSTDLRRKVSTSSCDCLLPQGNLGSPSFPW